MRRDQSRKTNRQLIGDVADRQDSPKLKRFIKRSATRADRSAQKVGLRKRVAMPESGSRLGRLRETLDQVYRLIEADGFVNECKAGERVQMHPATDAWMRGDRFGEIVKFKDGVATVKLDKSGKTVRVDVNEYPLTVVD